MDQEQFITQRVSLIVSKRCTLKCKLCGALAPYIENYHPDVAFLKAEVDAFFKIVDKTGIVDISGGEPFMRGTSQDFALGEIILYLSREYQNRFEHLRIFTNATVVPTKELCQAFREVSDSVSFSITIDDYGVHSPKVREISELLKEFQIRHDIRDYSSEIHCGGWVDLRDISNNHDHATAKELYEQCAIPQKLGCCLEMLDGILSPCSVAASRYICGKAEKQDPDIVDLFMDTELAKEKLKTILQSECFTSCHFCNGGMADDSPRYLPAEQASEEEIIEFKKNHKMRL